MLNKYYIPIIGFILFIIDSNKFIYDGKNWNEAPVSKIDEPHWLWGACYPAIHSIPLGIIVCIILWNLI